MDIKFSGGPRNSQLDVQAEKKKQGALVLLLFILIGGFSYVYFFTGLIKPEEAQKAVEAPVAAPKIVKMPLPPRSTETAKPNETVATAAVPKSAAPSPVVVAPAASAAKPVVAAATAPIASAAKSVVAPPVPVKPATPPPAAAPAKVAPSPTQPKPKEENKKSVVAKQVQKTPRPALSVEKKARIAAEPKCGTPKPLAAGCSWSVIVGDYILEEALSADLGRVRKSGFAPIVNPGSRKKTAMNRLLVSEFKDRASAASTLEKLQRLTSDGFVIEQGGKYLLFAGSYLKSEAANVEKERLKIAGFATTVKPVDIAIPTMTLSVGPFTSKKSADAARIKLQSVGLKATISRP